MAAKQKVDREEFTRLNEDGWTIKELTEHFGIHPMTVTRLRKQLDVSPDTRRMMTPDRRAAIEAMLDDGWSFEEIHRTEGAHPETLRKHFPGRAWTDRQRGEYQAALRLENPHYFNYRPKSLRSAA